MRRIDLYNQQSTEYLEKLRDNIIQDKINDFGIVWDINFILSNRRGKEVKDRDRPCKGACGGDCGHLCKNLNNNIIKNEDNKENDL